MNNNGGPNVRRPAPRDSMRTETSGLDSPPMLLVYFTHQDLTSSLFPWLWIYPSGSWVQWARAAVYLLVSDRICAHAHVRTNMPPLAHTHTHTHPGRARCEDNSDIVTHICACETFCSCRTLLFHNRNTKESLIYHLSIFFKFNVMRSDQI